MKVKPEKLGIALALLPLACGTNDPCPGESRFGGMTGTSYCEKASLKIRPRPSPSPSSSTYAFGTLAHTSSADVTFDVTNIGGQKASSLSSTLTTPFLFRGGAYPGHGGTCSLTLEAGDSCTVVVEFTPTSTAFATSSTAFAQDLKIHYTYQSLSSVSAASVSSSAASTIETYDFFSLSGIGTRCLTGATAIASGSTPSSSTSSIGGSTWVAQSFSLASSATVHGMIVKLNKSTSSTTVSSITLGLRADCSGAPCSTDLASGALIESTLVNTTSAEVGIPLSSGYTVSASTTYWAVIRADVSGGSIDLISDSSSIYASGQSAMSTDSGGSWSTGSGDLYFRLLNCP